MMNPIATYRFQFHHGFTFADAGNLIPYLRKLGIRTLYASPIFAATPGSEHGYDGIDPTRINPEIGTLDDLRALSRQLRDAGIGWVQDIVPNHMAYYPDNAWLTDVLEKGQLSVYAPYFDITGNDSLFQGKLMAPFLAGSLDDTIDKNGLTVAHDGERLVLRVNGRDWPLRPSTYATVLRAADPNDAVRSLLDQLTELLHTDEPAAFAPAWSEWLTQLNSLLKNEVVAAHLDTCLTTLNGDHDALRQLADAQTYRLCHGEETRQTINYRRFFTVDGLICLNIQHRPAFEHVHSLIKQLVDEGVFTGVRVDHIDGLYDPTSYTEQLRDLLGPAVYIVVEKILEPGERLPDRWPIQGTSGYDFLATVNNVLTNPNGETAFTRFYQRLIQTDTPIDDRIRQRKAFILYQYMGGELSNLFHLLLSSDLLDTDALAEVELTNLKLALGELLIQCPVYRYYGNQLPLEPDEAEALRVMLAGIRDRKPALASAVAGLETVFLTRPQAGDAAYNARALHLYQRCMQFTGPLMAKGVEDTLLYTYNRFIGHNEVGDSPLDFGMDAAQFHRQMTDRQQHWPLAMSATSTHDTKRGEGVRARLNVLTDLADEFLAAVANWQSLNADLKDETGAPDANDEYFIYQTLLGAYPITTATPGVATPGVATSPEYTEEQFAGRFKEYLTKAFQEAKRNTDWVNPNEAYLSAAHRFAAGLLDKNRPFWAQFEPLHRRIADFGLINSLAQVLLKFACPGVPDVYQGCEGWDLSLVDPDNRRPIDYAVRQRWLDEVTADVLPPDTAWQTLWPERASGKIKLWLVHTLLRERSRQPELYAYGDYLPLRVTGTHQTHLLAFARRHETGWALALVPLNLASRCREQGTDDVTALDWPDTRVLLPADAPRTWTNRLSGASIDTTDALLVSDVLTTGPLALLTSA